MFKLMLALNDLLAIAYVDTAVNAYADDDLDVRNGAISYLVRMQNAHVYEAYLAFVKAVEPKDGEGIGRDPVFEFIQAHLPLKQLFSQLQEISRSPYFNRLGTFRSNFCFITTTIRTARRL